MLKTGSAEQGYLRTIPPCAMVGAKQTSPAEPSARIVLSSPPYLIVIGDWVREHTCDEVLEAFGPRGADVPCARVRSPDELIDDPQLLARGMVERHPHPDVGEILFHGNPLKFAAAAPRARKLAPVLGEHNREVYAELGLDEAALERLAAADVI